MVVIDQWAGMQGTQTSQPDPMLASMSGGQVITQTQGTTTNQSASNLNTTKTAIPVQANMSIVPETRQ